MRYKKFGENFIFVTWNEKTHVRFPYFLVFWAHLMGNLKPLPVNLIPDHKNQNCRSYSHLKLTHWVDSFKITLKFLRKFSRNFGIWSETSFFIPNYIWKKISEMKMWYKKFGERFILVKWNEKTHLKSDFILFMVFLLPSSQTAKIEIKLSQNVNRKLQFYFPFATKNQPIREVNRNATFLSQMSHTVNSDCKLWQFSATMQHVKFCQIVTF